MRFLCPRCHNGALDVRRDAGATGAANASPGALICASCGEAYPIVQGVPRFVAPENYASSFGYQWNIHRTTQLDSHSGRPISRERLFQVTGWPGDLTGQAVLEAGSGAGRFTEVLVGTGAEIWSFDYSSAVDANYANNGRHPNLHLFQADIFSIPFREGLFDKVLCLGVIQHTPNPERAFRSLARQVRPGGELVIDVYTRSLVSLLQWKYFLRPLTKRMRPEVLYRAVSTIVPVLLPVTIALRRIAGTIGARLMPIVEYSYLGLAPEINRQWAILDTFDMYSPAHDHPQSVATVEKWFSEAGFEDMRVGHGPNGVVGKGRRRRTPLE